MANTKTSRFNKAVHSTERKVVLDGLAVIVLLDPKFAGSNPADDGFLSVIKIRSSSSFGGD
jgi:hypothetical protein